MYDYGPSPSPSGSGLEHNALTLDERRRRALHEVDRAKFSFFHVKVALVAGTGFFTDAYDLFAISIASTMIGIAYVGPEGFNWKQDLAIKIATPVGNLFGQVIFGWLADVLGRKRMYGLELTIVVIATLSQAISGQSLAVNFIGPLIFWRFIMGIGIGGDYPLSAVIASEFSAIKFRGRLMTHVFAAQGWGNFSACIVALITVRTFAGSLKTGDEVVQRISVDKMWRIVIGLGCIPATIALFFRLTIPETPRFTMDIERNVSQAAQDVESFLNGHQFLVDPDTVVQRAQAPEASRRDFVAYFSQWKNLKILLATCWCWFAVDTIVYGVGLNSSEILPSVGFGSDNMYDKLRLICVGNIILSIGGLIPGYYASLLTIDSWGRKPLQLMGFSVLAIIFLVIGASASALFHHTKVLFFLYCLANFFENFGPNTTTFIIPGEVFPTRYRSTAHGISAACGKLGAILSQLVFTFIRKDIGPFTVNQLQKLSWCFVAFSVTGLLMTNLLPETNGKSLEDLSNEKQKGFITGVTTHVEVENGIIMSVRRRLMSNQLFHQR